MTRKNLRKGILAIILATAMASMSACGGVSGSASDTGTEAQAASSEESGATESAADGTSDGADGGATNSTADGASDGTVGSTTDGSATSATASSGLTYTAVTSAMINFKSGDMYEKWTSGTVITVEADGDSASMRGNGTGIKCEGTDICITSAGTYVFEGTWNGTITVNVGDKDKVRLILNGFTITSPDGPAINIIESDKVTISLEAGTENVVTDSESYSDETLSAAICSKADLVFNGTGTLKVNGLYNNGIHSKDDLRIISGTYVINAVDDGLVGKDRLEIKDGTFTITSGGDAMKSTNEETAEKGFVYIADGTFALTAGDEAIDAASSVLIEDGEFTITTGDGSASAVHTSSEEGFGGQGRSGGREYGVGFGHGAMLMSAESESAADGEDSSDSGTGLVLMSAESEATAGTEEGVASDKNTDSVTDEAPITEEEAHFAAEMADEYDDTDTTTGVAAAKGIKCAGVLEIAGGTFVIDAQDDALHSGYLVDISNGTIKIKSGDDGIHADDTVNISGGEITIENSYEGIEGVYINISGGDVSVTASDDGINAAGGETTSMTSGAGMGTSGDMSTSDEAGGMGMPGGEMPSGEMPSGGMPSGEMPSGEMPSGEMPSGEMPSGEMPSGEMPSGEMPRGDMSGEETTGGTGTDAEAGTEGNTDASGRNAGGMGNQMQHGMGGMGAGMFGESAGYLTISGGTLYVNAGGDGLDANTNIIQTGGDVVVEGPTDNGNGALDYGNTYEISGGSLTALGSAGMLQNISDTSEAYALTVLFSDNVAAGTTLSIENSSGKEIVSVKTTKVAQVLQYAGEGLKEGGTYTLCSDGEELCTVTLTGTVTTVDDTGAETTVSGMGMAGGHMRA